MEEKDLGMQWTYRDPETRVRKDNRGNVVIQVERPMCHSTCNLYSFEWCPIYCSHQVATTPEQLAKATCEGEAYREWATAPVPYADVTGGQR